MQKDVRGGRRGDTTKLAPPYSTATLGLVTKKTPIDTFEEFADPKKAVNSKECINRLLKDEWDVYDSLFYNARLGVSIDPTRFIDPYILRKLRIETDIREMITQLGLGTMATRTYDLHVDLVSRFDIDRPELYSVDRYPYYIPMRDQGDFQRVVVDALRAIWARVSCTSRRTIRAHSRAAAGPSRQCRDPSSWSDDETSEDTD
ncbi:hypothetical protein DY000_02007550 [Brassica cretica]|uniref:Uncharacterized protein n=1 Tax=Brassica cretica TaxID=69181 RepID=A0ABQ7BT97_BRACR|nr:hypothetical protein DY000_02007550 [Brassica cretica]